MLRISLTAVLLVSVSSAAHADDAGKAKVAHAEAKRLYANSQKLTDKAAQKTLIKAAEDKYREAYGLDPEPIFLFNLAQMARLGENCPTALAAYLRVAEIFESGESKPNPKMERITGEKIDSLTAQCEPSDEFTVKEVDPKDVADPPDDNVIGPGPDDPQSGPIDQPGWSQKRKVFVGIGVGSAILGLGAGLFALNERAKRDEALEDFGRERELDPFNDFGEDPCASQEITPGPLEACERGSTAASRSNAGAIATLALGASALVFTYLAIFHADADDPSITAGSGPGDVGASLTMRF